MAELLVQDSNLRNKLEWSGFLNNVSKDAIHMDKIKGAYYDRKLTPRLPEDDSQDEVIKETAMIRKRLNPDFDGRQETSGKEVSDEREVILKNGRENGGSQEGGLPKVRLIPTDAEWQPTAGQHKTGEFSLDNQGNLYYCVESGTPGNWKRVQFH